jgi:hypothetical protein
MGRMKTQSPDECANLGPAAGPSLAHSCFAGSTKHRTSVLIGTEADGRGVLLRWRFEPLVFIHDPLQP